MQNQIAHRLHRSPATISQERYRNGGLKTDQHHKADRSSPEPCQRVPRKISFTAKKKAVVRKPIKKGSPDKIGNTPEAQEGFSISHQRTYIFLKIKQREENGMRMYPREKRRVKNGGVPETREQIRPQVSIHKKTP